MTALFLIGRILFGGFFLMNAYNHLMHTANLAGYAKSKNVPYPREATILSGLLLLIGGLTVVLGVAQELGLWALILFLIPTTFMMHAFWKEEDPDQKMAQRIQFMKNMAILGAVIMFAALNTGWPASF